MPCFHCPGAKWHPSSMSSTGRGRTFRRRNRSGWMIISRNFSTTGPGARRDLRTCSARRTARNPEGSERSSPTGRNSFMPIPTRTFRSSPMDCLIWMRDTSGTRWERRKPVLGVQFGGRARGSVWGSLGYYIQWTNAQFWGEPGAARARPGDQPELCSRDGERAEL